MQGESRAYRPWVMWLAPGVALGALLMAQMSEVPEALWLLAWGAGALLALGLWWWGLAHRAAWLLLGLMLGLSLMQGRMLHWQQTLVPGLWSGVWFDAQLKVSGLAEEKGKGWRVAVVLHQAPSPLLEGVSLLVDWQGGQIPRPGEVWAGRVLLGEVAGGLNPGGMDYAAWLFSQGMDVRGRVQVSDAQPIEVDWHWQRLRWEVLSLLREAVPPSSAFSGLNEALILGVSERMSPEQWQVLRQTGTLHLAVISGMHVTLVAGFGWLLALGVWRLRPTTLVDADVVAAAGALGAAVGFAWLAGFSVPVQRALIMLMVVMLAIWLRRRLHPGLVLSWALLLVLLWDVAAVGQPGFWLSFVATAMLVLLLADRRGWGWKLLGLHLVMSLLLAPWLAFFFGQVPLVAPLANALAAPVVEWMLVPLLLLAAVCAGWFPALTQVVFSLVDGVWGLLWQGLSLLAQGSWSQWTVAFGSGWVWLSLLLSLSALVLWSRWNHWRAQGLMLLLPWLPLAVAAHMAETLPDQGHRLTQLALPGEQLGLIWQTPQGSWLVSSADAPVLKHQVLPALQAMGIRHLQAWLVVPGKNTEGVSVQALMQAGHSLQVDRVLQADCSQKAALGLPWRWHQHEQGCALRLDALWVALMPGMTPPAGVRTVLAPMPQQARAWGERFEWWLTPGRRAATQWAGQALAVGCYGAVRLDVDAQGQVMNLGRAASRGHFTRRRCA